MTTIQEELEMLYREKYERAKKYGTKDDISQARIDWETRNTWSGDGDYLSMVYHRCVIAAKELGRKDDIPRLREVLYNQRISEKQQKKADEAAHYAEHPEELRKDRRSNALIAIGVIAAFVVLFIVYVVIPSPY